MKGQEERDGLSTCMGSAAVLKAVPLRCREMQSSSEKRSCSFHASSHKVKVHLFYEGFLELKPPNKIKFP